VPTPAAREAAGAGAAAGGGNGLAGVVQCCVAIHRSVEARSKRYFEELRRWGGRAMEGGLD
jgi:hypothetical protein